MNNKTIKMIGTRILAILLIGILGGPLPLGAEAPSYSSHFDIDRHSYPGEAGAAIFGRVFGMRDQGGDIDYYAFDMYQRSSVNASVRSFFVPGWGQAFNKERLKGGLFFVTVTAAMSGSYLLYRKSQDSWDSYTSHGIKNSSDYDDYEKERVQAMVLGGIGVVLWGFGIVDAYKHAYRPLWGQNHNVELSLLPDQTRLEWKHRF